VTGNSTLTITSAGAIAASDVATGTTTLTATAANDISTSGSGPFNGGSGILNFTGGSIGTGVGARSVAGNTANRTAAAAGTTSSTVFITDASGSAVNLKDNGGSFNRAGSSTGTFYVDAANGFVNNNGQTAVAANTVVLKADAGSIGTGTGNLSVKVNAANV